MIGNMRGTEKIILFVSHVTASEDELKSEEFA
jgi:hypothetical protein